MGHTDNSTFDFAQPAGAPGPIDQVASVTSTSVPDGLDVRPSAALMATGECIVAAGEPPVESCPPATSARPAVAATPDGNGPSTPSPAPQEDAPPDPYRGGPRTEEGKANSRANALKHGLTATVLLPEVLDPGRLDQFVQAFTAEYQPATPTEEALVNQIAQHSTALMRIAQIETALLRVGAAEPVLALLALDEPMPGEGVLTPDEIALAAAVDSDRTDRITRYRVSHAKGFYTALETLEKWQNRRAARAAGPAPASPALAGPTACAARFSSEEACLDYLSAWAREQPFRCPKCGHGEAVWLAAQRRRQCMTCRCQVAVRDGTVMARSHAPLLEWFRAIECVLRRPGATVADVAEAAGIGRRETAGRMAGKIRDALASPEPSQRLAGLDAVFGRPAVGGPTAILLHEADGEGPFCETNCGVPSAPNSPGRT